jgi:hypothetical protein
MKTFSYLSTVRCTAKTPNLFNVSTVFPAWTEVLPSVGNTQMKRPFENLRRVAGRQLPGRGAREVQFDLYQTRLPSPTLSVCDSRLLSLALVDGWRI